MSLGEKLQRVRTNAGISVRTLAKDVGVSPSFIYQVERGQTAPSLSTLKKIAEALNTQVSFFVEDELPEEWFIVRCDKRKKLVTDVSGLTVELATFLGSRDKKMDLSFFTLEPGAKIGSYIYGHERDDLIVVLSGSLEVELSQGSYSLEKGDAMYVSVGDIKSIVNPGDEKAEGLWVISPRMFQNRDSVLNKGERVDNG